MCLNHKIKRELKDNIANLISIIKKNPDNKKEIMDHITMTIANNFESKKDSTKLWDPPVVYDENGYPRF